MADAYAQHLATLHNQFEAPPELIARAARQVSSSPIISRDRIVHGEANEVYRLGFESGLEVILRIARRAERLFEKEAWAISRCRVMGVAAPEVLSIQAAEVEDEPLELCFLEKLPGERLSDRLSLPRETLRGVLRELGEQISRMHAVGWDDLGGAVRFFENDTDDFLAMEPEFIAQAVDAGLDRAVLQRAFRFFEITTTKAAPLDRRLTHNDFRACHVLVHEGHLSGLIDFGQVSMDTPINEFAKWDYWEAPALPSDWLRDAYADQSLFDRGYLELFRAYRIANALWALRWYTMTTYPAGVTFAADRLATYFAELGIA